MPYPEPVFLPHTACTACGMALAADLAFCIACGTKRASVAETETRCVSCCRELAEGNAFCVSLRK